MGYMYKVYCAVCKYYKCIYVYKRYGILISFFTKNN